METILFSTSWVIWCALHSTLVSMTVTGYLRRKLGAGFRFCRLSYNIFSMATIIPICIWQPTETFFQWEGSLVVIRISLFTIGGGLMLAGGLQYDMLSLAGIRQLMGGTDQPSDSAGNALSYAGILGIIRHPWYLAGIILIWGSELGYAQIIRNIIVNIYFVIGAYLEERKLASELGERYREYQRRVPMFVPYRWLKR